MHTSINQAVIGYVATQLKNGNLQCCEKLGFTENELRAINNMSINEYLYLCQSAPQFFKVDINHQLLSKLLENAKEDRQQDKIQNKALALEASIEMMQAFFGMSTSEVSGRRRLLGKTEKKGRKKHCSEEVAAKLWIRWQELRLAIGSLDSMEALDSYMLLAEEFQISLATVWNQITAWENEGLTKVKTDKK
ncbi:hypothetical protein A1D23_12975 [Chelonobacter oris]|uniref:DUF2857 domain-containing protein n=1 Tax=Chelonobacter oris TaxID=505317 RepID=UPI00244906EE|nr:DUF2857 domain-containing protein [Chelonobacter oris]MDH3001452.1 hypothetical protein [Chelonobacter oris]